MFHISPALFSTFYIPSIFSPRFTFPPYIFVSQMRRRAILLLYRYRFISICPRRLKPRELSFHNQMRAVNASPAARYFRIIDISIRRPASRSSWLSQLPSTTVISYLRAPLIYRNIINRTTSFIRDKTLNHASEAENVGKTALHNHSLYN